MTAKNTTFSSPLDQERLTLAFRSLAIRLEQNDAEPIGLVVCGGSALIMTGMVARTTRDVDIVALIQQGALRAPFPLPDDLQQAVREVAEDLNLTKEWLNNGPSSGEGGLFQMGLPHGLENRLNCEPYGSRLTVCFIGRRDQIHFKLYAAVDRGGYHIADLVALTPDAEEMQAAARWAMAHDVSEGFAGILKDLLRRLGYAHVADQL